VRRPLAITCALAALALLAAFAPSFAAAATREPLSLFRAELRDPAAGDAAGTGTDPRALASAQPVAPAAVGPAADAPQVSSSDYGPEQTEAVLATIEALPHGPEISRLSVYVAGPEELPAICGEGVLACYFPGQMEMVVSGAEGAAGGVPRDLAIAHEYGHHIANTEAGSEPVAPLGSGTIRWATYERVCQFTRAGRLFPGDQGAHYWQDPEEAFAETYADLADPAAAISWQYTPLLAPSRASLEKLRADLEHPWQGPVNRSLSGDLAAPPARPRQPGAGSGNEAIAGAAAVGTPPWIAVRRVQTPLDGRVTVAVTAPAGAELAVSLHDPGSGRTLAHGFVESGQSSEIAYSNCGRADLSLEVRSLHGAGTFEAIVRRP
jgi:hypothetical protein